MLLLSTLERRVLEMCAAVTYNKTTVLWFLFKVFKKRSAVLETYHNRWVPKFPMDVAVGGPMHSVLTYF
jgi:hypothetical protein